MSRWFRHYAGMARDEKLVRAALRSKQSIERVVWVWSVVLESAAELDDQGRYEIDLDEMAHFLRCKPASFESVLTALTELGRIAEGRVTAWCKRQFKSDRSNERVAAYRADKRSKRTDGETLLAEGGVTLPKRDGNSPETDTETDIPLSKDNGPAADPEKVFWDRSKAFLDAAGVRSPGAVIGKWLRDNGKELTAAALNAAQLERAVDPIAYCAGYLRRHGSRDDGLPPGHSGVPM